METFLLGDYLVNFANQYPGSFILILLLLLLVFKKD